MNEIYTFQRNLYLGYSSVRFTEHNIKSKTEQKRILP